MASGNRTLSFLAISILFLFATKSFAQVPAQEQSLWLSSKVYGSDNPYAALREVKITHDGSRYLVFIKNQFAFTCELSFSSKGQPQKLTECKSSEVVYDSSDGPERTWKFDRREILLRCSRGKSEVVCRGEANLVTGASSDMRDFVTIARKLTDEERRSAPLSDERVSPAR